MCPPISSLRVTFATGGAGKSQVSLTSTVPRGNPESDVFTAVTFRKTQASFSTFMEERPTVMLSSSRLACLVVYEDWLGKGEIIHAI